MPGLGIFEMASTTARKVLIVSSHPLFGKGIERLLRNRAGGELEVVVMMPSGEGELTALEKYQPDLVIVDEDDDLVNRDDFLAHFISSDRKIRVVLLSLKKGSSQAVVYDRRTMAASNIDDWLKEIE